MDKKPVLSPKEKLYKKQAQKILRFLKIKIRHNGAIPRPFMIEFFGSPSAGKTTCITELDKFLRKQGFRVWRPQEGAEVIRHIERTTPLYNIRTASYALNILIDQSVANLYDVIIFDRCLFDAYTWMLYWQEKGELTKEKTKLYQSFFLSKLWVDNIDIAYLVTCDPEIAIAREHRIALSSELGKTTNPETIRKLIRRCRQTFKKLSPDHPQLRMFDTTKMAEKEMVQYICSNILDTLESKIPEKK